MASKKRALPDFVQETNHPAQAIPHPFITDLLAYEEKSTRFADTPTDRIAAHELFDLFTATIIQDKTMFTR